MYQKLFALVLFTGLTAGFVSPASALFTSTASVSANQFTTGTVLISTTPATAALTYSNMAPGDAVSAPIAVSNADTLSMRYAITSVATNADAKGLMSALVLTVKSGVAACNNIDYITDGTMLYNGPLGSIAGINIVGDPASGAQTGDRTLPPTTLNSETLCFHVALPRSFTVQGAATTATFTFAAEQTQNN